MPSEQANKPSKTKRQTERRQTFLHFYENVLQVGEMNERQMANNVMQEMRVYDMYLVGLM